MIYGLRDTVKVGAVFEDGWPKPVWLDYKSRRIKIVRIFYRWREKSGAAYVVKFSVTDGDIVYEIEFDPMDMTWKVLAFDDLPGSASV